MKIAFNESDVLEQIKTVVDQVNVAWEAYADLVGTADAGPKPRLLSEDPADHMQGLVSHLENLLSERDTLVQNIEAIHNELGNKLKDLTVRASKFTLPISSPDKKRTSAKPAETKAKTRSREEKDKRNEQRRAATAALRKEKGLPPLTRTPKSKT